MAKPLLLIDGDLIAYKAATVSQEVIDWGDGVVSSTTDKANAEREVDKTLHGFMDQFKTDRMIVALSDYSRPYFRKLVYPNYKANRRPEAKPALLRPMRDYIAKKYEAKIKPELEADDTLGIMLASPKFAKGMKKIVISWDKDLLQIPGRHYNPDKDTKQVTSFEQGELLFLTQTLTGDSTDNYPGLPGVGPKKAAAILGELSKQTDFAEVWRRVVEAYEARGLKEHDAITQARLARILRHTDYNFKNKVPILWSPTSYF